MKKEEDPRLASKDPDEISTELRVASILSLSPNTTMPSLSVWSSESGSEMRDDGDGCSQSDAVLSSVTTTCAPEGQALIQAANLREECPALSANPHAMPEPGLCFPGAIGAVAMPTGVVTFGEAKGADAAPSPTVPQARRAPLTPRAIDQATCVINQSDMRPEFPPGDQGFPPGSQVYTIQQVSKFILKC